MSDSGYTPIDCGLHDHLELACLRGYQLRVATADAVLLGRARTTETDDARCEWLVLDTGEGTQRVRLDHLLSIEPLDETAEFGRIEFRGARGQG